MDNEDEEFQKFDSDSSDEEANIFFDKIIANKLNEQNDSPTPDTTGKNPFSFGGEDMIFDEDGDDSLEYENYCGDQFTVFDMTHKF